MYALRFFPISTSCIFICLHGFVFLGTASQEKEVYSFNPKAYIFWLIQHNEEDLASIKTLYKITAKSVLRLFLGKTYEVLKLSQLWVGTAGSGAEEHGVKHNTSINHAPNNNVLSAKNDNMITQGGFTIASWGAWPERCLEIIRTNMQDFNSSAACHLIGKKWNFGYTVAHLV